MRAGEPSSVALPLVSLGQPVWFWVLTVLVLLASPAPSLFDRGARPVSDRTRRGAKTGRACVGRADGLGRPSDRF
jgi:hypothetical protein